MHILNISMYAYNMFAHFKKPGKIIVNLRQEIEAAQIHCKYWPSLSAVPSDSRLYHFSAKSPLFLRTRPGLVLLNYLSCFANTISCINHSNDPLDCQVQESVFCILSASDQVMQISATLHWIPIEMLNCLDLALDP